MFPSSTKHHVVFRAMPGPAATKRVTRLGSVLTHRVRTRRSSPFLLSRRKRSKEGGGRGGGKEGEGELGNKGKVTRRTRFFVNRRVCFCFFFFILIFIAVR